MRGLIFSILWSLERLSILLILIREEPWRLMSSSRLLERLLERIWHQSSLISFSWRLMPIPTVLSSGMSLWTTCFLRIRPFHRWSKSISNTWNQTSRIQLLTRQSFATQTWSPQRWLSYQRTLTCLMSNLRGKWNSLHLLEMELLRFGQLITCISRRQLR